MFGKLRLLCIEIYKIMNSRVTVIIADGGPLNLGIPKDKYYPSTNNITQQLRLPYRDWIVTVQLGHLVD